MAKNDPEQYARQALVEIAEKEIAAREQFLIKDIVKIILIRHRELLDAVQDATYTNYTHNLVMGVAKRGEKVNEDQQAMFPELESMPSMLTYPTKNGMAMIRRKAAKREHWNAFIGHVTEENLRKVQRRNAEYVSHNARLEILRQIHGDLPEEELIRLAVDGYQSEQQAKV